MWNSLKNIFDAWQSAAQNQASGYDPLQPLPGGEDRTQTATQESARVDSSGSAAGQRVGGNWWEQEEAEAPFSDKIPAQVYSSSGQSVSISAAINEGGEGSVHPIRGDADRLVKIYHASIRERPERVRRLRQKIQAMLQVDALLRHPRFAWPRLEVFDQSGNWLGFAMMRAPGATLHTFGAPLAFQNSYPAWNRLHMVKVALNLAEGLRFLNANGVLMGDVNPGNVVVDVARARVAFIDCDSYQLSMPDGRRFLCEGRVDLYTPPELQSADLTRTPRNLQHERFAAAVLLFHVLMLGLHPYSHKGGESPVQNLIKGASPLGHQRQCQLPKGPWFRMWTHLPRPVQGLFERAFIVGNRKPGARPTLDQWCQALRGYHRKLSSGKACLDPVPADINDRRKKHSI